VGIYVPRQKGGTQVNRISTNKKRSTQPGTPLVL
jgi:hypothetical protein